jgi:hypothetical protein
MSQNNEKSEKSEKIKALEQLENQQETNIEATSDIVDNDKKNIISENKPNLLEGYKILEKEDMPQQGVLYPESWKFAYRCPISKEVANFSALNEQDKPGIIMAVEDLIRKCVVIYDVDKDIQINSGYIIDAHRTFFLLLLRDFYLPGNPIKYTGVCTLEREPMDIILTANKLIYPELSEKLINAYDGRKFALKMDGIEEPIEFLAPTIEITSRIFKYIVKVFKDTQNDNEKKDDKVVYDKNFLLLAPYLYTKGTETIKDITNKFNKIQKDDKLFGAYLEIINKLNLDNLEYIEEKCPKCGSVEENLIKFPGGWKKMFIGSKDSTGYF